MYSKVQEISNTNIEIGTYQIILIHILTNTNIKNKTQITSGF